MLDGVVDADRAREAPRAGFAVSGLILLVVACGTVLAAGWLLYGAVGSRPGSDLADVHGRLARAGGLIGTLMILAAGHAAGIAAATRIGVPRWARMITQAPYLVAYGMLPVWWYLPGWPDWLIIAGTGITVTAAWSSVWWRTGRISPATDR